MEAQFFTNGSPTHMASEVVIHPGGSRTTPRTSTVTTVTFLLPASTVLDLDNNQHALMVYGVKRLIHVTDIHIEGLLTYVNAILP